MLNFKKTPIINKNHGATHNTIGQTKDIITQDQ